MNFRPVNVVYDCNVFVQALININGPSGACIRLALAKDVSLFLSEPVLAEIRQAPARRATAKLGVTAARTETLIENLLTAAVIVTDVLERFVYSRDPDDAHYVNLALAVDAKLIVSRDRDLLSLMDPVQSDGRDFLARFPALRILDPVAFLRELGQTTKR